MGLMVRFPVISYVLDGTIVRATLTFSKLHRLGGGRSHLVAVSARQYRRKKARLTVDPVSEHDTDANEPDLPGNDASTVPLLRELRLVHRNSA